MAPSKDHESKLDHSKLEFVQISDSDPILEHVIQLGDTRSKWVGFFPENAFRTCASDGGIYGAIISGTLAGYIMYSVSKSRASIQQLCVNPDFEGNGIARFLVDGLRELTRDLDGIHLHCRKDFPAHKMWPKLGFKYVGEKRGRGKKETTLIRWWIDHGQPDLFTQARDKKAENRQLVVVDANVLYDLQNAEQGENNESTILTADWLPETVEYCVTREIFNEILRCDGIMQRKQRSAYARRFRDVATGLDEERIRTSLSLVTSVMPLAKKESDKSDRKQLAIAIAADVPFFVTRDEEILKQADMLIEKCGIRVSHPAEFVARFHELQREQEYQPARLAGTNIHTVRIDSTIIDKVVSLFLDKGGGEKKSHFRSKLRSVISNPQTNQAIIVKNRHKEPIALLVFCSKTHVVEVPYFRLKSNRLAPTLARCLAMKLVTTATDKRESAIIISDRYLPNIASQAFAEVGFQKFNNRWLKVGIDGIFTLPEVKSSLRKFVKEAESLSGYVNSIIDNVDESKTSRKILSSIERTIWPGRIDDERLPAFIVPIRPHWAMHLFDERLAQQDMFGAHDMVTFSCENAYYRSAKSRIGIAPARILWYVSGDIKVVGSRHIRACSTLDEVIVGKAKNLYRRFNRLGVYDWNDVYKTCNGNPEGPLMVYRFSMTKCLRNPIPLRELKRVLESTGHGKPPLITTTEISNDCFRELMLQATTTVISENSNAI